MDDIDIQKVQSRDDQFWDNIDNISKIYEDITPDNTLYSNEDVIFKINQSEEFKTVQGILRVLISNNEISMRSLYLSNLSIYLNKSNQSAQSFKKLIINHFITSGSKNDNINPSTEGNFDLKTSSLIKKELDWIEKLNEFEIKSYQLNEYRRQIISIIVKYKLSSLDKIYEQEYKQMKLILQEDEKNFHLWGQRIWLISNFQKDDDTIQTRELIATDEMIEADFHNNSVWNQRMFLRNHFSFFVNEENFIQELKFVRTQIDYFPENEAAWMQQMGVIQQINGFSVLIKFPGIKVFVENDISSDVEAGNRFAMKLKVELLLLEKEGTAYKRAPEAIQLIEQLKEKDKFRINYQSLWINTIRYGVY